ncbi:MAG TPA: co-chaperone GroES [Candidatus Paceibacterota bacterium]|nr:co-chaperone GroES [Candidatus Paceibacterota bacterium]
MAKQEKRFGAQPLGDRVVVRPDSKGVEKKLASGIILPESADKEKLMKGEVVAVGPGKRAENGTRIAVEVKVGDVVFFKKPWDEPIKMDDVEYYVLSESDISLIEA